MKLAILGMMLCCFSMSNAFPSFFGLGGSKNQTTFQNDIQALGKLKNDRLELGNRGALSANNILSINNKIDKINEFFKEREVLLLEISNLGNQIKAEEKEKKSYENIRGLNKISEPLKKIISDIEASLGPQIEKKGNKEISLREINSQIQDLIKIIRSELKNIESNYDEKIKEKDKIKKELEKNKGKLEGHEIFLANLLKQNPPDTIAINTQEQYINVSKSLIERNKAQLKPITSWFADNHQAWIETGLGIQAESGIKKGMTILSRMTEWFTTVTKATNISATIKIKEIKLNIEKTLNSIKNIKYKLDEAKKNAATADQLMNKANAERERLIREADDNKSKKIALAEQIKRKAEVAAEKEFNIAKEKAEQIVKNAQEKIKAEEKAIQQAERDLKKKTSELDIYVDSIKMSNETNTDAKEAIDVIFKSPDTKEAANEKPIAPPVAQPKPAVVVQAALKPAAETEAEPEPAAEIQEEGFTTVDPTEVVDAQPTKTVETVETKSDATAVVPNSPTNPVVTDATLAADATEANDSGFELV